MSSDELSDEETIESLLKQAGNSFGIEDEIELEQIAAALEDSANSEATIAEDESGNHTDPDSDEFPAENESDEEPDEVPEEPKWDPDPIASMRRLEAVLFLARSPITSRKLSQLAGLEDGTQARTMVTTLNAHYDKVGRAFHVKRVSGGYQMLTRPQFAKWIRRLEHVPQPKRISTPMIETLAVVAYRQPIIKADIEAIRGVGCGEILRQLLEKGLVKIAGRSSELGRPFLYATSKEFLTSFGFNSLDDLPRADRLAGAGLPQWASPSPEPVNSSLENNEHPSDSIVDSEDSPNDDFEPSDDDQEE